MRTSGCAGRKLPPAGRHSSAIEASWLLSPLTIATTPAAW
jgi:hypothetical protein